MQDIDVSFQNFMQRDNNKIPVVSRDIFVNASNLMTTNDPHFWKILYTCTNAKTNLLFICYPVHVF